MNGRFGKPKLDLQPRQVIDHLDASPMQPGNGGNDAEPEPVSGSAATLFESIESREDVGMLLGGNSRAIVGN